MIDIGPSIWNFESLWKMLYCSNSMFGGWKNPNARVRDWAREKQRETIARDWRG